MLKMRAPTAPYISPEDNCLNKKRQGFIYYSWTCAVKSEFVIVENVDLLQLKNWTFTCTKFSNIIY